MEDEGEVLEGGFGGGGDDGEMGGMGLDRIRR